MSRPETAPVIKTPIHTYRHARAGTRVMLVGMIHFGQTGYYETVQDLVTDQEADGAVVHYEKVRKSSPEALAAHSPLVVKKTMMLRDLLRQLEPAFADVNVVHQSVGMHLRPTWENHDAQDTDIAGRIGYPTLKRHTLATAGLSKIMLALEQEKRRALLSRTLVSMQDRMISGDGPGTFTRVIKGALLGNMDPVVLGYRNNLALGAIDEREAADPGRDFVLIWGAGHVLGLGEGLTERGYQIEYKDLVPAIDTATL